MQTRCRYPYCLEIIPHGTRWCKEHLANAVEKYQLYSGLYEKERNEFDKQYRSFYASKEWREFRLTILKANPFCNRCPKNFSYAVHHIIPLKDNWELRLNKENMEALCQSCHSRHELAERNKGNK